MPGYRGRLIFPFQCSIARLDTAATLANTAGGAFPGGGYDHVFREPQVVAGADNLDDSARVEAVVEAVPCQVVTGKGPFGQLQQMLGGTVHKVKIMLVFHYVQLEALDLVDADGSAVFKVNDRLVSISRSDGTVMRDFEAAPLYATHVEDRSFGLGGLQRNLLAVTFEHRDTSSLTAS